MKMRTFGALAVGGAAALSASALAQNSYSGGGLDISPTGNPAGGVSDILVGDSFAIADVSISLDFESHTWMGDLDVFLQSPGGTLLPIFVHVGGGTFGDSTNLGGVYNFSDSATGDIWATAASLGTAVNLTSGDYFATDATGAQTFFSSFDGENSAGTWSLIVTDTFPTGDHGMLNGWTLNLTPVPAPGAVALLGLAGLVGARRRRA